MNNRKQIRLENFDYSTNGVYFITICTKDKEKLFWKSTHLKNTGVGATIGRPSQSDNQIFELSQYGLIVDNAINNINVVYPNINVDKYVVMPNLVHLLLRIDSNKSGRAMRAPTISTIINQMKGYASKQVGKPIWQKSFFDHIIRNENDYIKIWEYIDTNPIKWELDCYYASEQ